MCSCPTSTAIYLSKRCNFGQKNPWNPNLKRVTKGYLGLDIPGGTFVSNAVCPKHWTMHEILPNSSRKSIMQRSLNLYNTLILPCRRSEWFLFSDKEPLIMLFEGLVSKLFCYNRSPLYNIRVLYKLVGLQVFWKQNRETNLNGKPHEKIALLLHTRCI